MLKFDIIWMRIDQIISLRNYMDFSETICTSQRISNFWPHPLYIYIYDAEEKLWIL